MRHERADGAEVILSNHRVPGLPLWATGCNAASVAEEEIKIFKLKLVVRGGRKPGDN